MHGRDCRVCLPCLDDGLLSLVHFVRFIFFSRFLHVFDLTFRKNSQHIQNGQDDFSEYFSAAKEIQKTLNTLILLSHDT